MREHTNDETFEPVLLGTQSGTTLSLLERISNHEHADVYRGSVSSHDAAIKIYRPATFANARDRALRESAAHETVNHVCVAALLSSGSTQDGRPYVASAWVDGETLEDRVRKGPLHASEVLQIMRSLSRGLAALHAKHIVHRDLKPSNIMLPHGGSPKAMLLDFGHALHLTESRITESSRVLGSTAFMSPEQAQGDDLDDRSDLYALGVVLFTCLTGRAPYVNDSAANVMMMHVHDPIPSPQAYAPDGQVPDALHDLCMWLLAKRREERVPNARVLQLTLDAIAASPAGTQRARSAFSQGKAL